MNNKKKSITKNELIILDFLWDALSPVYFSQILDHINFKLNLGWKKQSLQTYLNRLIEKGFIIAEKRKNKSLYHVVLSRNDYMADFTQEVLETYNSSITNLICALAKTGKLSETDRRELLEYLNTL